MTAALRRGACPSLAAPMATGDGWLARLMIAEPLTARQLTGLAAAAARLGNGMIEITARGSLQVRGLAEHAADDLATAIATLGIAVAAGVPVLTSPLAGLDPDEIADPRPLAAALRGFAGPLPPKASAVVDGAGRLHLDEVPADLRLRAVPGGWLVAAGGTAATARALGVFETGEALAAARELLGRMSRANARARDLPLPSCETRDLPAARPAAPPVGRIGIPDIAVHGVGLPFGQAESGALAGLAAAAGAARFLPAPGRTLLAIGLAPDAEQPFAATAERLGFVTRPDDARLAIAACAGAPACASARLSTRRIAAEIAASRPELSPAACGCTCPAARSAVPSRPARR